MSSQYAGTATYPADFPIAADNAPATPANFNPAAQALGDRTAFLKATSAIPVTVEYLANATIVIPADALPWILHEGCGGGGQGGLGGASLGENEINSGGGGGGGAVLCSGTTPVVPGESYALVIGAGGTGSGLFGLGIPGGDTTLTRVAGGTVVLICQGASGGHSGGLNGAVSAPANFNVARGGRPVRTTVGPLLTDPVCEPSPYPTMHLKGGQTPQAGGLGVCSTWTPGTGMPGSDSPQGQHGGEGGTLGKHASSYRGGGAGGGGGAGAYGGGAKGGSGSDASASVGTPNGGVGESAAANSGGGGGGGGGAGASTAAAGTSLGGAPGAGGSGRLRITIFRRAVP